MITFEQQKNTKAIVLTAAIHVILLLCFYWLKIYVPAQPITEELGMEVNLGLGVDGFGDDQHEDPNDPANLDAAKMQVAGTDIEDDPKQFHSSDDADAPIIKQAENPKKTNQKTLTENPKKQTSKNQTQQANTNQQKNTVQKPKYAYQNTSGRGGNAGQNQRDGSNEGRGVGNGDAGVIGGTSGASNYTGTPGKGSTSWPHTLNGRHMTQEPEKTASFSKGGKVKVRVSVDRNGNINKWSITSGGSSELNTLVAQKISKVKFNKSDDAPAEQTGIIEFNFKVGK